MTEPLADTWDSRDLPALRAIVQLFDASEYNDVRPEEIERESGLTNAQVNRAAVALHDDGLIEMTSAGPGELLWVTKVSGEARRMVGAWPTAESGVDRLVAALEQIAQNTDDEEDRTRLQQFAGFLKTGGKQVGLSVATAVITGQLPS
jgi:hypothetical protein